MLGDTGQDFGVGAIYTVKSPTKSTKTKTVVRTGVLNAELVPPHPRPNLGICTSGDSRHWPLHTFVGDRACEYGFGGSRRLFVSRQIRNTEDRQNLIPVVHRGGP